MRQELALGKETLTVLTNQGRLLGIKSKPCLVDIALIKGARFYVNLKRKENKFFITSLYKIDYIINKKSRNAKATSKTKEEILKRTMPKEYYNLILAFLKKELDKLPPYYAYDYKIKLIRDMSLGYYPLYY